MCGLVGVIGDITATERTLFKHLLLADVVRGMHSTGVMAYTKDGIQIYKKAMPSYDFLELPKTDRIIGEGTTALIGHNRHATMGAKTSANAHPFQHGDIALVHNGTLTNKNTMPNGSDFSTDSEGITYNLSRTEEPIPFLESLGGAYALMWLNELGELSIAKNDERPLHWFEVKRHAKAKSCYVFASEQRMGEWCLSRTSLDIIAHGEVQVGKLITIDTDTLSMETEDFTPKPATVAGGISYGNWVYPQNRYANFVVDSIRGNDVYGTTIGERVEYDVEMYMRGRTVDIKVGDMYRGKVLSVNNGKSMRMSAATVKKYMPGDIEGGAEKKEKKSLICGWCSHEITELDFKLANYVQVGQDFVHSDCDEYYTKQLQRS